MQKFFSKLIILFAVLVSANFTRAQSIESYWVAQSFDVCGTYWARAYTSGYVPGQTFKFFWGDGTNDTGAFSLYAADTADFWAQHYYAAPGAYTVKMVLYNGAPLDSVVISEEMHNCHFLKVWVIEDENLNCVADSAEPWVHEPISVEVDSAGIHIDTISVWGCLNYRASGVPGTVYRFRVIAPPPSMSLACGGPAIIYDTIPAMPFGPVATKAFLFNCFGSSPSFDLKVTSSFYSSILWNMHAGTVLVNNTSCVPVSSSVRYDFSPKFAVDSVRPAYAYTVSGTSLVVDIGLVKMNRLKYFDVYMHPVVSLLAGDTANSTITVMPFSGDTLLSNNVVVRCDTVKGPYDPNRKSVTPQGDIAPGTRLEYLLEFENTGNDTARNIHIMDTLSPYLDPTTFGGGNSTHNVAYYQYSDGGNNIVKFDFPNIMLPDSSSPYRHGMVSFYINAREGLSAGTTIPNRAGIYFDVNEVVMTNTAYSHIPVSTRIGETVSPIQVKIYPNPVDDVLRVATEKGQDYTISIYNVVGQSLMQQRVCGETSIDVSRLMPGIYYAVARGASGAKAVKFEKR
ncbi:MAG: T9SS type A sorting domain-containing protein [Taibaiella sp.]|nr:T9SS type A sorting domain-containing protein [Taibaiella sp.]